MQFDQPMTEQVKVLLPRETAARLAAAAAAADRPKGYLARQFIERALRDVTAPGAPSSEAA